MNPEQQIQALTNDLMAVIQRYRSEFDITLAAYVGALELVKLDTINTA